MLLDGWRAHGLALVTGGLSALSLAPLHLFPVLFVTLPIFVWLLDGAVPHHRAGGIRALWPAFRTGFLFGFGYFLGGLWWIGQAFLVDADEFIYLLPLAVAGLPFLLALFWGVATALTRLVWVDGWPRLIAFATFLTLLEFARGSILSGFPWNLPGYAFMPVPIMMQTASLIGAYGMTWVTLFVAASPAMFAPGATDRPRRLRLIMVLAVALFAGHLGYGMYSLSSASDDVVADVKLRLVQPNIDQRSKWDPGMEEVIFRTFLDLSANNTGPKTSGPAAFTHIIWPESAFPFIIAEQKNALAALGQLLPETTTLVTGAMRREPSLQDGKNPPVFNSALVFNGNGEIIAARDKTHLVPFGEYLPLQSLLESWGIEQLTRLPGGFAAGNRRETVQLASTPSFLTLICYEIIYPGSLLRGAERPGWIINLTNDAWFGASSGPYQHAHQSQIRAVEEGLPVVRVANTGISFVSDAWGRVEERLPLGAAAVLDSDLPVARAPTVFASYGNVPILVFICLMIGLLVGVRVFNTNRL